MLLPDNSHYKTIGKARATGLYHGMLYRRLPTGVARSRWVLESTTPQGFDSPLAAAEYMNACLPDLPPLNVSEIASAYASGIPEIPLGSEVELRIFKPQDMASGPSSSFPAEVIVRVDGQETEINLTVEQLLRLVQARVLELDSDTFDRNLSCGYAYFRTNQC